MSAYVRREIAQLGHQLKLSPKRLRPSQVAGVERLLRFVRADKCYPYDLICYHVTGYESRKLRDAAGIPGEELIGDLVQLIDELTRSAPLAPEAYSEPVYTLAELAQRLDVSTKTVGRWRKRGLICRRVLMRDGKTQLTVLDSDARRFVQQNIEFVRRAAAFKQLDETEKTTIIEEARELLSQRRMRLHEVAQTLSERTGRAVETIRYTLRRYDQENPGTAIFADGGAPTVSVEHRSIHSLHERGESVATLARQFKRPKAAIEAILREMRCRRLMNLPLDCIYSAEFDSPSADEIILGAPLEMPSEVGRRVSVTTASMPAYLRELFEVPVLTREQEASLFRRYNYIKFKVRRLLEKVDPLAVTDAELARIEGLVAQADAVKNELVRCNLRLVVSIAKKHVTHGPRFFEVVSDGNMALMRAVEKFDYARGHKFSTYATWSVMRAYARSIPEELYQSRRFVSGAEAVLEHVADETLPTAADADQRSSIREALTAGLRTLNRREREVVERHFGLGADGVADTLEEIGRLIGVTKERVRQIERKALAKLRGVLPPNTVSLLD